jgi:hypothetical protein
LLIIAILPLAKEKAKQISCYNTLRAGECAFWIWAGDNNDKFPMELSTNFGGAKEPLMQGKVSEGNLRKLLFGVELMVMVRFSMWLVSW